MVKTATTVTCQNGDTKTATDFPDQNGDELKRWQDKTAMGTAWHGSYMHWTCVLGRRPQYTTRSHGRCEYSQPYGFNNRLAAPTHWLSWMLDVVPTRQNLTAPDVEVVNVGLSDHSLLQWSASSACPTQVVEETFTGHQRIPVSTVVCSLSTKWLARPCGIIWHRSACHPRQARLRHLSAYSHTLPTRGDSYIPILLT